MKHSHLNVEDDLAYLKSVYDIIVHKARLGYAEEGRGAMIVDLTNPREIGGGYLSISRILVELGTVPDQQWEQTLQGYHPQIEFVAIVRRADQSLHGYVLNYLETNDNNP